MIHMNAIILSVARLFLRKHTHLFMLLLLLSWSGRAQIDSTQQNISDLTEALEDFLQNAGNDDNFDFNTLFEQLEIYLETPLNLN